MLCAVAAYGSWGLFPLYFKAVRHVPALEIITHRVLWSLALLSVLVLARRGWPAVVQAIRNRQTFLVLAATTLLIATNWLTFVWAVVHDRVLESSLGYFINPLVNVLLGTVFLKERLRRLQVVGVLLAAVGVAYLTAMGGHFPVLALVLAGTFGLYGLLRKVARVDALVGLTIETALLAPVALGYLIWLSAHGQAAFLSGTPQPDVSAWLAAHHSVFADFGFAAHLAAGSTNALLIGAGLITAIPLLWFTEAARRLRLATMGFLQYLAPTGQFLLAVLAFGEPFRATQGLAFACIWTALVIYSVDAVRAQAVAEALPPAVE